MTYLTQRIFQNPISGSQFLALVLMLIGLHATSASAQQPWSTPDPSGNIHNTNTGKVGIGIGANNPESLLHLAGPSGVAAITFNSPGNQRFRFQTLPGVRDWGGLTLGTNFFSDAWHLDDTNANGWFLKLETRGGNGASIVNGLWLYRVPPGLNPHIDETREFGITNGRAYFAGNVGIGTDEPSTKLHVVGHGTITGNLTVTGNIAAKYQDMAEWVSASEQIPAGTVVVLDSTRSNHVISSTRGYDTRVAGVISVQPGITLGERGENKVLVATTGRVRLKVDASKGPIQIGDLLVTSDIPGMAMKSQAIDIGGIQLHRPGTLVGKALENLAKGRGEILVLLSLQ